MLKWFRLLIGQPRFCIRITGKSKSDTNYLTDKSLAGIITLLMCILRKYIYLLNVNTVFIVEVHVATLASLQAPHSNNRKQIIQIKHNTINNPNLHEADQLAIYNHGQGIELGTILMRNKPIQLSEHDSNLGPPD